MEKQPSKNKRFGFKVINDILWSIAALVIMNGTIQLVIYPAINRKIGTELYGDMLYLMSIASVFSAGIGMALNNGRLLRQKNEHAGNGDYLLLLALMLVPSLVVIWFTSRAYVSTSQFILLSVLAVFMSLRYYSDAEYRLTLNYRRYFLYYAILTGGYVLGILIWDIVPIWQVVFLLGEVACVFFCICRSRIYCPLQVTSHTKEVAKVILQLAPSYILYNLVVQMDRIMLRTLMDSSTVTIYYVASLLGKVIALLVGPLNSIIISYLTRPMVKLNTKTLATITCGFLGISSLIFGVVCVVSPSFVRLLYPDIFDAVMEVTIWSNLTQIICFTASLELTVLLIISPPCWQILIQSGYAVFFFVGGYIGIQINGLQGFISASLLANLLRLVVTFIVLIYYSRKTKNTEKKVAI